MINSTKIKDIDRGTIRLAESSVGKFSFKRFFILIGFITVLFFIGALFFYMIFNIYPNPPSTILIPYLCLLMVSITFIIGEQLADEPHPAFRVFIPEFSNNNEHQRIIVKTTSDADQKEICRATSELETVVKALSKKERELEQIAFKCRRN